MNKENWRQIEGFEGLYDVSDQGRVYSYYKNRIKNRTTKYNGYLQISLNNNGKQFIKNIHRLVAESFLPNPEGYPEVNHINEDKTDNRVENLEFVSHQFNTEFSQGKAYVLYDENDQKIEIFNLAKFARDNGLDDSALIDVAQGKINSIHGYTSKPGTKLNRQGKIQLMSPKGEVVIFENQQEAKDYIEDTNISQLLRGKRKTCKGWTLPDEH